MGKFIDLTGQRFGKLTAISRAENRGKITFWACNCNCGNSITVDAMSLKRGNTKSCGCSRFDRAFDLTGQKFGKLTATYRTMGSDKHIKWYCLCDCGNSIVICAGGLRNGNTKSCGCLQHQVKDLTGQKFGKLTAISQVGIKNHKTQWLCACDCGNKKTVLAESLKNGNTKSCGCLPVGGPKEDLTGRKFGKLTVISYEGSSKWSCLCDCGRLIKIRADALKNKTRNCRSCRPHHYYYSDRSLAAKNDLYRRYKRSAKLRGYHFTMGFDEFIRIIQQDCYYCGEKSNQVNKVKRSEFVYTGLDRVMNSRGYDTGNVKPCCKKCNRAKWQRNKEEFISWISKCRNHLITNNL